MANQASTTCPSNDVKEIALQPQYNFEEDLRQIPVEGYPVQNLTSTLQHCQGHPLGESVELSQPGVMCFLERDLGAEKDVKVHRT